MPITPRCGLTPQGNRNVHRNRWGGRPARLASRIRWGRRTACLPCVSDARSLKPSAQTRAGLPHPGMTCTAPPSDPTARDSTARHAAPRFVPPHARPHPAPTPRSASTKPPAQSAGQAGTRSALRSAFARVGLRLRVGYGAHEASGQKRGLTAKCHPHTRRHGRDSREPYGWHCAKRF